MCSPPWCRSYPQRCSPLRWRCGRCVVGIFNNQDTVFCACYVRLFWPKTGASGSKALAKSASRHPYGRRASRDCKVADRLRWRRLEGRPRTTAAASRALPELWAVTPLHTKDGLQNLLRLRPPRRFENMRPLPEPALLQPRMPAERLEKAQGELCAPRATPTATNKQVR